jgi:hypothetical protein
MKECEERREDRKLTGVRSEAKEGIGSWKDQGSD